MTSTYNIRIQIINDKKPFKDIKEPVNFPTSDLKDYINVLRTTQKAVNCALTEIIDQEKSNESIADECMEDEDDEDSDVDEKPNSTAKRKLVSHRNNKKIKV